MTNKEDKETLWDKHSNHIVLGVFILVATIMIVFWLYTLQITNGMVPDSAKVGNQPSLPGTTASLGDSYGATNALFSGLAMVAAITAIAIQTFEFRYQRKELSITNDTHRERLEFDRAVHEHARRLQQLEMFREFSSDDLQGAVLAITSDTRPNGFEMKDAFLAAMDSDWEHQLLSENSESDLVLGLHACIRQFREAEKLLYFISDLSLLDLSDEELRRWNGILGPLVGILGAILHAETKSRQTIRPMWVNGVQDIVNRLQDSPK